MTRPALLPARGLTAERARERKAAGLCPRHDVPAAPGETQCARCLGKVNTATLYRVSQVTLDAMAAALREPRRRAQALTRPLLILALALCLLCCGCAANNVGGASVATIVAIQPEGAAPRMALTGSTTAPADSLWLRWHAPLYLSYGCAADTSRPAHDAMWQTAYRLQGQPPFYRRGCEYSVACWDSVRAYGEPREVGRVLAVPGQACSLKVASGEYFVRAQNAAGASCWGNITRVP